MGNLRRKSTVYFLKIFDRKNDVYFINNSLSLTIFCNHFDFSRILEFLSFIDISFWILIYSWRIWQDRYSFLWNPDHSYIYNINGMSAELIYPIVLFENEILHSITDYLVFQYSRTGDHTGVRCHMSYLTAQTLLEIAEKKGVLSQNRYLLYSEDYKW